jgi:hypothetical protein
MQNLPNVQIVPLLSLEGNTKWASTIKGFISSNEDGIINIGSGSIEELKEGTESESSSFRRYNY